MAREPADAPPACVYPGSQGPGPVFLPFILTSTYFYMTSKTTQERRDAKRYAAMSAAIATMMLVVEYDGTAAGAEPCGSPGCACGIADPVEDAWAAGGRY